MAAAVAPPTAEGGVPVGSVPPAGDAKPASTKSGGEGKQGGRRSKASKGAVPPGAVTADAEQNSGEDMGVGGRGQDNAVTQRLLKTKMCYFFERGKCASQSCRYAHSIAELKAPPNLQKTKLCKSYAQDGTCADSENCVFAHGEAELRYTEGIYKSQMCHFFERGRCLKGERCNHAHGIEDLRASARKHYQGHGGSTEANGSLAPAAGPATGKAVRPPSNMQESVVVQAAMSQSMLGGGMPPIGAYPGVPVGTGLDGRSPLSPLSLADLVGNANAAAAASVGFPGAAQHHYYQPPPMGYHPGLPGLYFEQHDAAAAQAAALHQQQSQEAAAAAALATAQAHLSTAHTLGLPVGHPPPPPAMHPMMPPPPAAPWSMSSMAAAAAATGPPPPWSPSPPPAAAPSAAGFGGVPAHGGSPGTPMNFGLSPGASPNPPMVVHSPTPSPCLQSRVPITGLGPNGLGPLVGGPVQENGTVCDLENRLKSLDVVVRDLAAEARGFTAVATVGAPIVGQATMPSTSVVGGDVAAAPAGHVPAGANASENRVLHRI
eukprot:TRINITY_DN21719_c0_g1_i1.p1 TRINITY_DN21719_c0_g1~~TRINITY_DN21719_c0_g1_i1.p1  ORF type:complete len:546 (+),score=126.53 TRINITY_DN21719_c0_g1_i1:96-1733(+)